MKHRGFALWMAILLVGFIGVVVAATTSLLRTDIQRTAADATDAQFRQLLLAGQAVVREQLDRTGAISPQQLAGPDGAQIVVKPAGPAKATVTVSAAGRQRNQSLEYARDGQTWRCTTAVVD